MKRSKISKDTVAQDYVTFYRQEITAENILEEFLKIDNPDEKQKFQFICCFNQFWMNVDILKSKDILIIACLKKLNKIWTQIFFDYWDRKCQEVNSNYASYNTMARIDIERFYWLRSSIYTHYYSISS